MKYILFQDKSGAKHGVMFSDFLTHRDVSFGVCRGTQQGTGGKIRLKPISAGFVNTSTFSVSGRSESMALDSNPDDGLYLWGGQAVAQMPPHAILPLYNMWRRMGNGR